MAHTETAFHADLDTEGLDLTPTEIASLEAEIDRVKPLIREFPTQVMHVNVEYHPSTRSCEVKIALVLPGQTFATGNVSESWQHSLEVSVSKLIRRIEHYKAVMSGEPHRAHEVAGTDHELQPDVQIDGKRVTEAVDNDDYSQFRNAMDPIESNLRDRIGRWVQRYPQIEDHLGERFKLDDIVEETFLMAFDRYEHWPAEMFFGQWIETLIDPAIKQLIRDPEGELEIISFQKSWRQQELGE